MSEKRYLATLDKNGNLIPFRYGGKHPKRLHDKVVICATFDAEGNEIPLPFFGGQEGGTIPENILYLAEVAENTIARHEHPYLKTLNAFSESEEGDVLLWKNSPIQGSGGLEIYESYFSLPEEAPIGTQALVEVYEDSRIGDVDTEVTYDKLYLKPNINYEKILWMLNSPDSIGHTTYLHINVGENTVIFSDNRLFPNLPKKSIMILSNEGLPLSACCLEPIMRSHIEDAFVLQGIPIENILFSGSILFGWYRIDTSITENGLTISLTNDEPYVFENGGIISIDDDYGDYPVPEEAPKSFFKYILNSSPWQAQQQRFEGYWLVVYSEKGWVKV